MVAYPRVANAPAPVRIEQGCYLIFTHASWCGAPRHTDPVTYEPPMFRQLTLLVAVGLVGPILASGKKSLIPVVIGELAAGALIGNTGFQLIDPHAWAFPVFYSLGFAMLMMAAGTHVDLRSPEIRSGAPRERSRSWSYSSLRCRWA